MVDTHTHGEQISKGLAKGIAEKKKSIWDTLAEYPDNGWTVKTSSTGRNKRELYNHAHFTANNKKRGGISGVALMELLASQAWKDHMTQKKKQLPLWRMGHRLAHAGRLRTEGRPLWASAALDVLVD